MPEAYCGMHTAHIFILLCVPWLVYSEGATKSGSDVKTETLASSPCPTSRDLYGSNRRPCRPNGRPLQEGWDSFRNGLNSAQGGWPAGNTGTAGNRPGSGDAWSSAGSSGNSGRGSWSGVGSSRNTGLGGWSGAGSTGNTGLGGWSAVPAGSSGNTGLGGLSGAGSGGNIRPGGWPGVGSNGGAGSSGNWNTGSAGGGSGSGGWNSVTGTGANARWPQSRPQGNNRFPPQQGNRFPNQPGYRPHRTTRRPHHFHQPKYCRLRAVHGPCRARMNRWHFNHRTGQCEKFVYGGCLGNSNNFISCSSCLLRCTGNPRTHRGKRCGRRYAPFIYIGERK